MINYNTVANDESDNTKKELEKLYNYYLKDELTTILVVHQASSELKNSNAFSLVR